MSFSLSTKRWSGLLLVLALALASARAGEKEKREKMQFSGTPTATESNLTDSANDPNAGNRMNPAPGTFRQAQESLLAPLINAARRRPDSMQEVLPVPRSVSPAAQPSPRARRLLDQQRNWAFADYTDLNETVGKQQSQQSLDNAPLGNFGDTDQSASLIQRYYDRLGRRPSPKTKTMTEAIDSAKDFATHDQDEELSAGGFADDKNFIKQLHAFAADPKKTKGDEGNSQNNDFFGKPPTQDLTLQKQRLDDYQHLLNPNLPPSQPKTSLNPVGFNQFLEPASVAAQPLAAKPARAEARRNPLYPANPFTDPTVAALRSSTFVDPTVAAFGGVPVVPKPAVAEPMTVEKMQNMLDPFAAVAKKRSF